MAERGTTNLLNYSKRQSFGKGVLGWNADLQRRLLSGGDQARLRVGAQGAGGIVMP